MGEQEGRRFAEIHWVKPEAAWATGYPDYEGPSLLEWMETAVPEGWRVIHVRNHMTGAAVLIQKV